MLFYHSEVISKNKNKKNLSASGLQGKSYGKFEREKERERGRKRERGGDEREFTAAPLIIRYS